MYYQPRKDFSYIQNTWIYLSERDIDHSEQSHKSENPTNKLEPSMQDQDHEERKYDVDAPLQRAPPQGTLRLLLFANISHPHAPKRRAHHRFVPVLSTFPPHAKITHEPARGAAYLADWRAETLYLRRKVWGAKRGHDCKWALKCAGEKDADVAESGRRPNGKVRIGRRLLAAGINNQTS